METAIEGNKYRPLLPAANVRSLDLAPIARLDRTGVVVTAAGDRTHHFLCPTSHRGAAVSWPSGSSSTGCGCMARARSTSSVLSDSVPKESGAR